MAAAFQYRTRNFRDIGGVRGTRGLIRRGLLFRSAQLDGLLPDETDMLARFGLTLALDLRDAGERAPEEKWLNAALPGISVESHPLMGNLPPEAYAALMEKVKHIHTRPPLRLLMAQQYAGIMTRERARVLKALRCIMAHHGPLVFFCVAGKDRTGILAMLVEMVLGLSLRGIWRDYRRTNDYFLGLPFWRVPSERARRQYRDSSLPLWGIDTLSEAHPVFLGAALKVVADAGGVDHWLSGPDGIDPALIRDFRARLLVS